MVRFVLALALPMFAAAADWPEWRGAGRTGVWNESGVLEAFPADGLKVRWRTPLRPGFSGPAVARGRVFVTDFVKSGPNVGTERALALEPRARCCA